MSPQRYQRRASWALAAGVAAIVALIFSVWLVGSQFASDLRASEAKARAAEAQRVDTARHVQTLALRAGCARAVARDFESWETNADLAGFARDAARARRASGQPRIAARYVRRARDAERRMAEIKRRLPSSRSPAVVAAFCRRHYPDVQPR